MIKMKSTVCGCLLYKNDATIPRFVELLNLSRVRKWNEKDKVRGT